jgi:hypothetical protein
MPSSRARWRTAGAARPLARFAGVADFAAGAAGAARAGAGWATGAGSSSSSSARSQTVLTGEPGRVVPAVASAAGTMAAVAEAAAACLADWLPAPATSSRISSAPTASETPMSPPSATTVPLTGDGISTVALSVITSHSTWSSRTVSPGFTRHSTTSTSAMPSPRSGILITWIPITTLPWRVGGPHRRGRGPENKPIPGHADTACPSR